MMTKHTISIVLTGYKDKNLYNAAKHLKDVTLSDNFIHVFDQHPIMHSKEFSEIQNCHYEYKIWDDIHGPAYRRATKVFDTSGVADYVCIISPDIKLSHGWDIELISKLENSKTIFSGSGNVSVVQRDLFSIGVDYSPAESYSLTQVIDRNFIFGKTDAFAEIVMPDFLKYSGENEYLSLAFLSAGYSVMSIPSHMYLDSKERSVENTYHTFSLEHNYNIVVDLLNSKGIAKYKITEDGVKKFLSFHQIDISKIHRLPYNPDDVLYDPYDLQMHKIDARRFLTGTKAIY
jgi:hypothetical protein